MQFAYYTLFPDRERKIISTLNAKIDILGGISTATICHIFNLCAFQPLRELIYSDLS